jgi:hypothetical protein
MEHREGWIERHEDLQSATDFDRFIGKADPNPENSWRAASFQALAERSLGMGSLVSNGC